MPKLSDVLKQAGVKEEVITGLPAEVVTAVEGYVTSAETTLTTAQQSEERARQTLEAAGATKAEVDRYIEEHAIALDKFATLEAQNKSLVAYLTGLKEQGMDIKVPTFEAPAQPAQPAVPGSPARGANVVTFDPKEFSGRVSNVMAQLIDANNEHFRLTGQPLPDSLESLQEAIGRSGKTPKQFLEEKYNFSGIRKQKSDADYQAALDKARKEGEDAAAKKYAEMHGSNPMTRSGQSSTSPYIKKITHDDIEKSSGFASPRERRQRLIENIQKDIASQQTA